MPGATSLEREAEVALQVWERWFLKFDLPLRTLVTPHVAPCTRPSSCVTVAPHPCPFPLHPQFLLALSMDPTATEAFMEKMMEKMTDKVVCACVCGCVCVCLLAYESYLLSVVFA